MSFEEKKVLVVGTGKSGVAATGLLLKEKVQTVLFDADKELDTKAFFEKNPSLNGVSLILGDLSDEQIKQFDIAVLSPGVPTDIPMVNRLRDAGVKIWGEIELAYAFGKGRIIAITGTNGKAKPGYHTLFQRNSAIGFIQCSCRSSQIFDGLAVMPDTVVSTDISFELNTQSLRGKFFFIIDQVQP